MPLLLRDDRRSGLSLSAMMTLGKFFYWATWPWRAWGKEREEEGDTKFSRSRLGSAELEDNSRPCFASYDETRLLPLVRAQPPFMVL